MEQNWHDEPENKRTDVGGRERVWKSIITPDMISEYGEIRERVGGEGEIVDPEVYPELRGFLEQAVAEQYDTATWVHKHTGRKVVLKQKPLRASETFYATEGQIEAFFDRKDTVGGLPYKQQDTIPKIRDASIDTTGPP